VKSTAMTTDHLRDLNPVPIDARAPSPSDSVLLERILTEGRTAHAPSVSDVRKRRVIRVGALGTVSLAVLVVLLFLVVGSGSTGPAQSSPWRLVSFDSAPFRDLGSGQGQPGLQCVSNSVCFSPPGPNFRAGQKYPIYRTTDGGRQWKAVTYFSPASVEKLKGDFNCANAETCSLIDSSGILLTADQGSTWRSITTPVLTQHVGGLWCVNALRCLIREQTNGVATGFAVTSDGGVHWTTQPAPPVPGQPWTLTCDANGSCLEVLSMDDSLIAVSSATWGGPWKAHLPVAIERAAIVHSTCSGTQCMFVLTGTSYQIVTTSDGGLTWHVSGPPKGWLNTPTAVDCSNGNDCWIALYDSSNPAGAHSHPTIESTQTFGQSWTQVSLPKTTPPIADVLALGCTPSGDGCLAVGNGRDHFVLPKRPRTPLSGPVLLSSLP
jgi:photosystem II stability/assembly factor-like uncharacterized protein